LEAEVDAKLHRAVAGVDVAAAQEIVSAVGGGGINGVFGNAARNSGGGSMRRERVSGRGLGIRGEYVAQEVTRIGVVEYVVDLPAKFQCFGLAPVELLEEGEIEIDDARPG